MSKPCRSVVLLSVFLSLAARGAAGAPAGWPSTIKGDNGFRDLGKAIAAEPGYPKNGSDVEKARYVFARMGDVAGSYGLKTGDGSLTTQARVGIGRLFGGNDPENADTLKAAGVGNCGEWSYAMLEIFTGSGVHAYAAYGDKSEAKGASIGFAGTDTMVIVEEAGPSGRLSRRVFDAFRAGYHGKDGQPTAETIKRWADMPLTDADRWGDEKTQSWQGTVLPFKPYVKNAGSQIVLPHTQRMLPGGANRPASSEVADAALSGVWESDWGPVTLGVGQGAVSGSWNQGGGKIGKILGGSYEAGKRVLTFRYYQDWNKLTGAATFTLSADGLRLSGTWTQPGSSGGWTMTRKAK